MKHGSKSAYTLVEVLVLTAVMVSAFSGVAAGLHGGVPYALAGLGMGIWVSVAIVYLVYFSERPFQNVKEPSPVTVTLIFLSLCAFPILGPLFTSTVTTLLVKAKPLPGYALTALAIVGICDAYSFSKRQVKRVFASRETALK